jgi:hypothetical protein
VGDFNGDGKSDFGVYGPYGPNGLNRLAVLLTGGGAIVQSIGGPLDHFVSGDFDGDGKTDIAVYGPYGPGGIGRLAVTESTGGAINMPFGGPLDTPLPPPLVPPGHGGSSAAAIHQARASDLAPVDSGNPDRFPADPATWTVVADTAPQSLALGVPVTQSQRHRQTVLLNDLAIDALALNRGD